MAPQVFTRVMAPVSAILHHLGIRMCRYLDDWLIQAPSRCGSPGSGDGRPSLSGSQCRHQLGEVQSPTITASGLSGCYSGFHSFQGDSTFIPCIRFVVRTWNGGLFSVFSRKAFLWLKLTLDFWSDASEVGGVLTSWTQPLPASGLKKKLSCPSTQGSFLW